VKKGILSSLPARVVQKYLEDQAPNWAVLIAWNALFAMFPMMLFIAALLGLALKIFGVTSRIIYNNLVAAIPDPKAQQEVLKALAGVQNQTGLLFIVGLIGLLWGGSALFGAMEQAFAVIYRSKARDFIPQRLMSFGMVFLFVLLAGVAVGSSSLLPALEHIPNLPDFLSSGVAAFVLQVVIGVAAGFILFGCIYYFVPNRRQRLGQVLPGALVAGVLFEINSLLFPIYLSINKGINAYGSTFALFFVLLTFFWFMGLITMAGIEVNSVLFPDKAKQPAPQDTFTKAAKAAEVAKRRADSTPDETDPEPKGSRRPQRGIRARTAVILALAASVAGVVLGRRSSANS
jgi:membrane protein